MTVKLNLDEIGKILKQARVYKGAPYHDHGALSQRAVKEYLSQKGRPIKNMDQHRLRIQKKAERRKAHKRKMRLRK